MKPYFAFYVLCLIFVVKVLHAQLELLEEGFLCVFVCVHEYIVSIMINLGQFSVVAAIQAAPIVA